MSRYLLLWLLVVAGLTVACKKQDSAPPPDKTAGPMAPASPRGPVPVSETPAAPAVVADTGDVNATLAQLTQQLRDYVVRSRSVPKTFDEFASKAQLQFPPAPAGKKYSIEGQAVVLVNR